MSDMDFDTASPATSSSLMVEASARASCEWFSPSPERDRPRVVTMLDAYASGLGLRIPQGVWITNLRLEGGA